MDAEREQLTKLKKSTKSMCESASTHYKNECHFAEALCQLGYVQDMNQDPQLGVAFTNFATLVRALADLTYDRLFVNFMSKNFLMTIRTVLADDVNAAKNDAKKSFEKAFRDYEAKYTKAVQREKRQSMLLAETGSVSGLASAASVLTLEDLTTSAVSNSSNNAIHHELNEEKRALQMAMFEINLNENELRAKRGVNVLTQLLEMYHVLRRFFREGLETVDQFATYIDSFALQLQQRRKQLSDERKVLADFRIKLQRSDSSLMHTILTVPPSLLPETYNVTTTTSTLTPSKPSLSNNNLPSSSSTHNITTTYDQTTTTLPNNNTTTNVVSTSNSSPGSLAAVAAASGHVGNADYSLHQPHGDKRCGTQRQGYLMMKKLDSSSISQSLKISLLYKRFVKRYVVVQDGNMLIVTDPSHVDAETAAAAANATINSINSDNYSSSSKSKGSAQRHKSTIRLHLITCQAKPVVPSTAANTTSSTSENDEQCSFDVVSPRSGTLRFLAPSVAERDTWLSVLRNSQQEALQTAFNDAPDDDDEDDVETDAGAHDAGGGDDYADTECDTPADLDDAASHNGHDRSATTRKNITHHSKKQRLLPAIKKFVLDELETNRLCCDCNAPVDAATAARSGQVFDATKDVTWISTNFGTVLCIECSGIHRALGVHVSRVQSLKLDRLSPAELLVAYALGGNRYFNNILEAKLASSSAAIKKPSSNTTMDEKRSFIQQKYVQRAFANAKTSLLGSNLNGAAEKQKIAAFLRTCFADLRRNHPPGAPKPDTSQWYSVGGISLAPLITAYAAGIDLCGRYFENDQTLLHILVREGDDFACLPLVEFIVQNAALSSGAANVNSGAHFNRTDADDNTPVHLAAAHNRSECLKLLLRAGADWKAKNKRGKTALDEAVAVTASSGQQNRCAEMLNEAKIGTQYYATFSNVKYSWNLVRHGGATTSKTRSKSVVSDNAAALPPQPPLKTQTAGVLLASKSSTRSAPLLSSENGAAVLPVQTASDDDDDEENNDDEELVIVDADHFKRDHVITNHGVVSTIASPGGSLKPQRQGDAATTGGRIAFRALPPPRIDDVLNDTATDEAAANSQNEPVTSSSSSLLQHYLSSLRAGIRRRYSESPGRLAGSTSSTSIGDSAAVNEPVVAVAGSKSTASSNTPPIATMTTNSSSSASSNSSSLSNPHRPEAAKPVVMPSKLTVKSNKIPTIDTVSEDAVSLKLSSSPPVDEMSSSTMPRRQQQTAAGAAVQNNTSNYNTLLSSSVAEKRRHSAPEKDKTVANNDGTETLIGRDIKKPALVSKSSQSLSGLSSSEIDDDDEHSGTVRAKRRGTLTEAEMDTDHDVVVGRSSLRKVNKNGEVVNMPPILPPKLRRKTTTTRPISLAVGGNGSENTAAVPINMSSWLTNTSGVQPPLPHPYQRFPLQQQRQQYRPPLVSLPQIVSNNNNSMRNGRIIDNSSTDIYSQPPSDHHQYHRDVRKTISSSSSQFSPADHHNQQQHMMAVYAATAANSAEANLQVSGRASVPGARPPPLPLQQQQQQQHTPQRYPLRHGASFFASPSSTNTVAVVGASGASPANSTKSYHHHLMGANVKLSSSTDVDPSGMSSSIASLPRQRKSYSAAESTTSKLQQQQKSLPDGCVMRCCALYDCVADRPDELSFRAGDIIVVTREHTIEPQWMEGYAVGNSNAAAGSGTTSKNVGLFPASFVYRLPD